MEKRTGKSYIWPTWISGLLAGTDRCQWKSWVKAHYRIPRLPSSLESKKALGEWNKRHDEMVKSRVERLKSEGYQVKVEDENYFSLQGNTGTLAGKQDIVAYKPEHKFALVVDEKSGRAKEQYIWQILLYMFAMKLLEWSEYTIHGEIEYEDTIVPVLPHQLTEETKIKIGQQIQLTGGDFEPPRTPSLSECRYCDILSCPDRITEQSTESKVDANIGKYF
jgi:PD-(D/E)XK nuclease superfamily